MGSDLLEKDRRGSGGGNGITNQAAWWTNKRDSYANFNESRIWRNRSFGDSYRRIARNRSREKAAVFMMMKEFKFRALVALSRARDAAMPARLSAARITVAMIRLRTLVRKHVSGKSGSKSAQKSYARLHDGLGAYRHGAIYNSLTRG